MGGVELDQFHSALEKLAIALCRCRDGALFGFCQRP